MVCSRHRSHMRFKRNGRPNEVARVTGASAPSRRHVQIDHPAASVPMLYSVLRACKHCALVVTLLFVHMTARLHISWISSKHLAEFVR
jgi:hypothetical protein